MSPNITLSWVLALAPEIGLLVVLFMVLVFVVTIVRLGASTANG